MTNPEVPHIAIQEATRAFLKPEAADWAPYLIVLGPPGSGKSGYLRSLKSALKDEASAVGGHLLLDLRQLSINDEDRMYLELASLCSSASPKPGRRAAWAVGGGARAFEESLCELVDSLGRVTLYVDNLESVPRYFARALTRKFRQLWEERYDRAEYCHLGVVFSGSLSLFELKQDTNSIFTGERPILLPFLDSERRLEYVRQGVQTSNCEPPSQPVLDLLASATGGELAFLEPLLKKICRGRKNLLLDEGTVVRAIEELSSPSSSLPILEDIALHLYGSPDLLDIVRQLDTGQPYVRPRDPAVDIDRFHLMGAVVLDRDSEPPSYRFRNGMIERYCRSLLSHRTLQARNAEQARGWQASSDTLSIEVGSGLDRLESIQEVRMRILRSPNLWESLSEMRRVWALSTLYPIVRADLYLHTAKGFWWWFDSGGRERKQRPSGESDEAPIRAVEAARRDRNSSFGLDSHEVAFAVPLHGSGTALFLVVHLRRSDLDGSLGENALIHWQRFVQEFAAVLENLALAELGREALKKETEVAKPAPAAGNAAAQNLQIAQRLAEEQVDRLLDRARLVILALIVLSIGLGTYKAVPWVIDNWPRLEPLQSLISLVLTIVWAFIAFLGFRFDPFHLWKRFRRWLRPRLIQRQTPRWQRRLGS